eukprot:NODE_2893_length_1319_cov_199.239130_g2746_i0.p1 GENE.NODE_2893_length_1319_cov_199.239130_g2746_i0~~NODE_2893_length_1319_cov_199.239130_g2746_i0.p1  ORF type:complete len:384 (-),score=83.00 NODE_2893_length_1319_cov_199.239130_g2746_i0:166-1254(-)
MSDFDVVSIGSSSDLQSEWSLVADGSKDFSVVRMPETSASDTGEVSDEDSEDDYDIEIPDVKGFEDRPADFGFKRRKAPGSRKGPVGSEAVQSRLERLPAAAGVAIAQYARNHPIMSKGAVSSVAGIRQTFLASFLDEFDRQLTSGVVINYVEPISIQDTVIARFLAKGGCARICFTKLSTKAIRSVCESGWVAPIWSREGSPARHSRNTMESNKLLVCAVLDAKVTGFDPICDLSANVVKTEKKPEKKYGQHQHRSSQKAAGPVEEASSDVPTICAEDAHVIVYEGCYAVPLLTLHWSGKSEADETDPVVPLVKDQKPVKKGGLSKIERAEQKKAVRDLQAKNKKVRAREMKFERDVKCDQ